MGKITASDTLQMSVEERISLVMDVWDTIHDSSEIPPITPEQLAELERRAALHALDPKSGSSWEEVKARLLANL